MDAYNTHKVSIKEKLKTALSKIHISFDLWTSATVSRSMVSLLISLMLTSSHKQLS
jgi:site-specific recombinase